MCIVDFSSCNTIYIPLSKTHEPTFPLLTHTKFPTSLARTQNPIKHVTLANSSTSSFPREQEHEPVTQNNNNDNVSYNYKPKLEEHLARLPDTWSEIHGESDWAGLLDPMAQACYDAFDFDPFSKYCGSCRKMVTQFGIKLAVHLITNHFGNLVAKVCQNLFSHGPLSLGQLIRYTELTKEQVKNSLLVLVQHNCAQAFLPDDGINEDRVRTQYMVLFDNIIHRLRFPKFLEIVSQRLDEECVELVDGLLRDGRLTLKQMADRASQGKENAVATKAVQELLCKLLTARLVERCPAPEPVVSTSFKETTAKKRGAKSAKIFEVPETLEQRVLEAAVPGDAIRFSLTADMGCNVDGETNSDDAQMNIVEENVAKTINIPCAEEEQILWRANFEEFIRHLRNKALIENVRTQHDDGTATVLSAVLEATRALEKNVKIENSVPLSLDTITTEVMKTDTGRTLTIDRIRASLSQLGCSQKMIVDDSYSIDLKKILERARNEEVESIVLKRYGRDAYRMFRLLSKDGGFRNTDEIAASTLVEKKEAPKFLFKLMKDNYLHRERVVVPAGRPSDISLWKVNKPLLWEYVLDEMYHAALNLNLRMAFEQEKDEELLNVPKDKLKEPGPLQKKYKRLLNVWLLLGSSLMKLDEALMLFHDF